VEFVLCGMEVEMWNYFFDFSKNPRPLLKSTSLLQNQKKYFHNSTPLHNSTLGKMEALSTLSVDHKNE
jgi:hypothetical protein